VISPPLTSRSSVGRFLHIAPFAVCLPAIPAHRRLVTLNVLALPPSLSRMKPTFLLVLSLRPSTAMHHPHYSRTTPAFRLPEYQRKVPTTRTVCYYASHLGKGM
jgi:hypothetical protein